MKTLRGVAVALVLMLTVSGAWAQAKDELFAGAERFAQGAKEANEVNLDKNSLGMLGEKKGASDDFISKMEFIYVRSYEYDAPGKYKMSDLDVFRKRLDGGKWSHIVSTHEEKEQTDVWVRSEQNGETSEMVVITAEERELNFVHLKGHMPLKDLTKVGGKFGAVAPVPQLNSH